MYRANGSWFSRAAQAALLVSACRVLAASDEPAIVPRPVEMRVHEGAFAFSDRTRVVATGEAVSEAQKLIDSLATSMGRRMALETEVGEGADSIQLRIDADLQQDLGGEGYRLRVAPERIDLSAARPAGLFYGVQTLRQLLPPRVYSSAPVEDVAWTVPCVEITDYPRFAWRGLLIDPARHFIPVVDVKRFIDLMAIHKFNRLQMHLNDDQGWRIEIRKYPG
jgi:hexosaminidase